MKSWTAITIFLLSLMAPHALAQAKEAGKAVYEKNCALCHASGLAGAPRFGQGGEWAPRLKAGTAKLYQSALKGTALGMPGRGGNMTLSDAEVTAAVDYIVASVGGSPKSAIAQAPSSKPAPASTLAPAGPAATVAATTPAPAKPLIIDVSPATTIPAVAPSVSSANPNTFNRLLTAAGKRNPPPPEDGIHDPGNPGTHALQTPLAAFAGMPPLNGGNRVNWVKSLGENRIQPRWDHNDAAAAAVVMDLNIVREVKGSMPDVVYPHKQHTEWLDCSACHPAIFIPQKGANQISMAAIMLGQKCGVCHGKVAFPVSECRLCHSKNKESKTVSKEVAK